MELELTEAERLELENLYLKRELLGRDLDNLYSQLTKIQAQIEARLKEIAKAKGYSQDHLRLQPQFEGYRLVRLLVENPAAGEKEEAS